MLLISQSSTGDDQKSAEQNCCQVPDDQCVLLVRRLQPQGKELLCWDLKAQWESFRSQHSEAAPRKLPPEAGKVAASPH